MALDLFGRGFAEVTAASLPDLQFLLTPAGILTSGVADLRVIVACVDRGERRAGSASR